MVLVKLFIDRNDEGVIYGSATRQGLTPTHTAPFKVLGVGTAPQSASYTKIFGIHADEMGHVVTAGLKGAGASVVVEDVFLNLSAPANSEGVFW